MGVVGAAGEVAALSSFDHRDHRFHLGALSVGGAVEANLHEAAVAAAGRFARGSAMFGGDDRPGAALLAGELVIGFRIVAGIGHELRESHDARGLGKQGAELIDIGTGAASGSEREEEVIVDSRNHAQLGEVVINHGFPRVSHLFAAADEVAARRGALEAGRIDGRPLHPFLATQWPLT